MHSARSSQRLSRSGYHARHPAEVAATRNDMSSHLAALIATLGSLAGVISVLGLLAVGAWVAWRLGPTLTRVTGWCSWWVAWGTSTNGQHDDRVYAHYGALERKGCRKSSLAGAPDPTEETHPTRSTTPRSPREPDGQRSSMPPFDLTAIRPAWRVAILCRSNNQHKWPCGAYTSFIASGFQEVFTGR
jgi:hypothetical protein